jgi:hypothetical protein
MEKYIQKYDTFTKKIVYKFEFGYGGLGDFLKFFIYILNICLKNNYKLYYLINNNSIEKYIKLKYPKMYITNQEINNVYNINNEHELFNINNYNYLIVTPFCFYENCKHDNQIKLSDVFEFSDEIRMNSYQLLPNKNIKYISIHLRLGDYYLENNTNLPCKEEKRVFNENNLFYCIEQNYDKNIIFFCENNNYKLKIKQKYNNVIILNSEITHTTLSNNSEQSILDTITEFYIMTNSEKIYAASISGFSFMSSRFNNIEFYQIDIK